MNSKETLEEIKKTEPKKPVQKSNKKKCLIILGLTIGIVVIITAVILLVAHYKYGLFGPEIYKVADIKRDTNSVEYFTETKNIKTKLGYTSGESEEIENKIETNFVVMITDKKGSLNTANLVILNSTIQMKDKEASLNSFDIFDKNIINEFEQNPNGTKYPIALFHFYENGEIKDINLPNELDKETAQSIIDLINSVIPKLSRNKTEDDINGVIIRRIKDKKYTKSFSEYESPKEFFDKYSNSRFKKSTITKEIERDINNEKISEIRAKTNLFLQTYKEEGNQNYFDFGIKNYYYNTSSKIILTKSEKDKKEHIDLIQRLTSKLNFTDGEKLIKNIIEKEIEEQNKLNEKTKEDIPKSESQLRDLSIYEGSFGYNWDIIRSNILGQEATINYFIGLDSFKLQNYLIIKVGSFTFKIGNEYGMNPNKRNGSTNTDGIPIAYIPLGALPVTLTVKIGASLEFGGYPDGDLLEIKLEGSLYIKAGLEFGLGNVASIEAGVKGDLIKVTFLTALRKNWELKYYKERISLKFTTGTVSIYATAKVLWWTVFSAEYEVMKGTSIGNEITW